MRPEALLAIRSDIANAVEQEYLEWLTREHTIERVAIEGFLSARIFRSRHPGFGRYLILYELADASVVDSPAYLERLNNPTPWTTRMMPHLGNFVRGGGAITTAFGEGYGAAILPLATEAESCADCHGNLEAVSRMPGVVAVRVLETDAERTGAATNERKLRSGDETFRSMLMIEALDELALQEAITTLPRIASLARRHDSQEVSAYSQIFNINRQLSIGKNDRGSKKL